MAGSAYGYYGDWAPYVPVGERKRLAKEEARRRQKKGQSLAPVQISGRRIATTFWGTAWCENLANYSDFANRLPRGRTYARNGSIVDLQIKTGEIAALVAGSTPYDVNIKIKKLDTQRWMKLQKQCAESIHSLIDLMRGALPSKVLHIITDPKHGMFPAPKEINLRCSCPDGAFLCKHIAAVLYGVGHRLDTEPELFFRLRGVDQKDLITEALSTEKVTTTLGEQQSGSAIDSNDLESIFGISLATADPQSTSKLKKKRKKKSSTRTPAKSPTAKSKGTISKKKVAKRVTKKSTQKTKSKATRKRVKVGSAKKKATKKKSKLATRA